MRSIRISIAFLVSAMIFTGIVMIYSSSGVYAMREMGDPLYFLKRHLLFLLVGLTMMAGVMSMDYRDLRKIAKPLVVLTVFLLGLVLIPGIGKESFGARRWLSLGPINFQPAEFAKVAMIIYTADFLARKEDRIRDFYRGFVPVMVVLGITAALILKQPDLGSTILIGWLVVMMIFIAGARWQHLSLLAALALPAFYFLVVRVPYRWTRIITFLDPWQDAQGAGFQLTQSQIAFGSGGFFGLGLGQSLQKLFYLPAAHTDFILSIVGEELGFAGVSAVVLLFIGFIWQGARIAKRAADPFGYFLSIGIVGMIGLQAVVNVGVSIGALPTKGLPLPFISYGGSALVFNMTAVGLLLNVSRITDLEG